VSKLAHSSCKARSWPAKSWSAKLKCHFEYSGGRTIVQHEHHGPLRIQRPFYPEDDVAHVYMLHPPGGVVGGDKLAVNVASEFETAGLVTTPVATKFYRSNGQTAKVSHQLDNNGGSLEWFPQENIFFRGCKVRINSNIRLHKGASLAWWDINCFGRGEDEKSFSEGSVSSVMNLWVDKLLLFRERVQVSATCPLSLSSGLRGNSTIGTLLVGPVRAERVSSVRQCLSSHSGYKDQSQFSVTAFDELMIVRYLGASAEQAKSGFIQVWSMLRRELNGKSACLPRIWAT